MKISKLALSGGEAVRGTPLPKWPHYEADEIEIAKNVLQSGNVNYWTGEECRLFEREFAEYVGVRYGVALANGTLALELALRALGISAGDEVIVTPRSYFASASCIVLSGAVPVFADVDSDSQNISVEEIEARITARTKAILTVHLAGWPCEMSRIMELARNRKLWVIEDCAQAHGAAIDGKPVGSFGHIGAFSFCQDKIMSTAGEGGMLVTDDPDIWEAAWSFKDHGKNYRKVYEHDHPPGFRWLHDGFGSNWRLTEIQGAIGRLQLRKLDQWVNQRRRNAGRLLEGLKDVNGLRIPVPSERDRHAYYRFYAFVVPDHLKPDWGRDRILEALTAEGIPGLSGACPEIYREHAFANFEIGTLPNAYELGATSLMFLVHPTLSDSDIDDMVAAVRKVLSVATN